MNTITVVDARMGRGKTSAAIRYMNENKESKRFLYITPRLSEVDRICEMCDFDNTDGDGETKSSQMRKLMREGKNIAATHALFNHMNEETLNVVAEMGYSLIIDEAPNVIETTFVSPRDLDFIMSCTTVHDDYSVTWNVGDYYGVLAHTVYN